MRLLSAHIFLLSVASSAEHNRMHSVHLLFPFLSFCLSLPSKHVSCFLLCSIRLQNMSWAGTRMGACFGYPARRRSQSSWSSTSCATIRVPAQDGGSSRCLTSWTASGDVLGNQTRPLLAKQNHVYTASNRVSDRRQYRSLGHSFNLVRALECKSQWQGHTQESPARIRQLRQEEQQPSIECKSQWQTQESRRQRQKTPSWTANHTERRDNRKKR